MTPFGGGAESALPTQQDCSSEDPGGGRLAAVWHQRGRLQRLLLLIQGCNQDLRPRKPQECEPPKCSPFLGS